MGEKVSIEVEKEDLLKKLDFYKKKVEELENWLK